MLKECILPIVLILLLSPYVHLGEPNSSPVISQVNMINNNTDIDESSNRHESFFIKNNGQWNSEIMFLSRTNFGQIAICDGYVIYNIEGKGISNMYEEDSRDNNYSGHIIKYTYLNIDSPKPKGLNFDHFVNFFIGNDSSSWISNVPCYRSVIFKDLWPGIDLQYRYEKKYLKYDYILHPDSDPSMISLEIEGHTSLRKSNNDLVINYGSIHDFIDSGLITFYRDNSNKIINSTFVVNDNLISFDIETYDSSKTVVVDPLISSTYFGGSDDDYPREIYYLSTDKTCISGMTYSEADDFPLTPGSYSHDYSDTTGTIGFISVLNSDLSELLYSTYLGGTSGSTSIVNICEDNDGNIIVAGATQSGDFPVTDGTFDTTGNVTGWNGDNFVSKFNYNLTELLSSTYIGGTDLERATELCVDDKGSIYIGCVTGSSNYPTTSGAYDTSGTTSSFVYDVAVSKFNEDLTRLIFSTYIHGTDSDDLTGMVLDSSNNIFISGSTRSTDFPITAGAFQQTLKNGNDGFVTLIKNDGSDLIGSTFLGGNENWESIEDMVLAENDSVWVVGATWSTDFPTTEGCYSSEKMGGYETFITNMNHDLTSICYSTYFGGSSSEGDHNIALNPYGQVEILGITYSKEDFPVTSDAYSDSFIGGYTDVFFTVFSNDLSSLRYSTYFGGTNAEFTYSIAVDPLGGTYLLGYSNSTDFPVTEDAYETDYIGQKDIFISLFRIYPISEPLSVDSLRIYSDNFYTETISEADKNQEIFIEIIGEDCNSSMRNYATVNITFSRTGLTFVMYPLRETGNNTGIFRNSFIVPITAEYFESINVKSKKDPSKYYEIFIDKPNRPDEVYSIEVYSDSMLSTRTEVADKNESVFILLRGKDSDPDNENIAFVNISSESFYKTTKLLLLSETGKNTGIYQIKFTIPILMDYMENITFTSVRNENVNDKILITTHVLINPILDNTSAFEDEYYHVQYSNSGWSTNVNWYFSIDLDWLTFDPETLILSGTPSNDDVGKVHVRLTLEDDMGHRDVHNFEITVANRKPTIDFDFQNTTEQDSEYSLDFDSDDEMVGDTTWHLATNASWLSIDEYAGILSGTTTNEDVGYYNVRVWVEDGNGGKNSTEFTLTVLNKNDRPLILTSDIPVGTQGMLYKRDYDFEDIDMNDIHTWILVTDASWLSINDITGVLMGTPGPEDVGEFYVNVSIVDNGGLFDFHNFTLNVENVNDKPIFESVPSDTTVMSGTLFSFDVNATDYDPDDVLHYSISSNPVTDIDIDVNSGEIEWLANVDVFEKEPYRLSVEVSVTDGEFTVIHSFKIIVKITTPPTVELVFPLNDEKTSYHHTILEWDGFDEEGEDITYDVYIGNTEVYVSSLRDDTLFVSDYSKTRLNLTGLTAGKKYFWTVIPNDGGSDGVCDSGVFSFILNTPPSISPVDYQLAKSGVLFRLLLHGSDGDDEDSTRLKYSLQKSPKGMIIDEDSGMLRWTPGSDQIGLHKVIVNVSDGIDVTEVSFTVEIEQGPENGNSNMMLLVVSGIVVLVIIVVLLSVLLMRKRKSPTGNDEADGEVEEQVIGPKDDDPVEVVKCDVALTPTEAHAHLGKGSKAVSYEDLYGVAPPDKDEEGLTAGELKDFIHEQIENLEKMETEE